MPGISMWKLGNGWAESFTDREKGKGVMKMWWCETAGASGEPGGKQSSWDTQGTEKADRGQTVISLENQFDEFQLYFLA